MATIKGKELIDSSVTKEKLSDDINNEIDKIPDIESSITDVENSLDDYVRLDGTSRMTGALYAGGNLYSNGKTSVTDGLIGGVLGQGALYLTTPAGSNPAINFYRAGATSTSATITNTGNVELQVNATINPTVTNTFNLGTTALRWNNIYGQLGSFATGLFTGAKTAYNDGLTGGLLSNNGVLYLNSSGNPVIHFQRSGVTSSSATIECTAANILSTNASYIPTAANYYNLGSEALRWNTVFAGTANFSGAMYAGVIGASAAPVNNAFITNIRTNTFHPMTSAGSALGTTSVPWDSLYVNNINGSPASSFTAAFSALGLEENTSSAASMSLADNADVEVRLNRIDELEAKVARLEAIIEKLTKEE